MVTPAEDEELEEEEEEEVVVAFTFKGVKYLRSSNNVLYDAKTHDEVGVFNEATQEIEELEEESDEEED